MTAAEVLINRDADGLAHAVAARFITKLADVQSRGDVAQVVLTGGRVAAAVYRAVAGSPARTAIDWSRVEFWWGDERFLPEGDPDRNETQARDAFLNHLGTDPARVHPMPADTGQTPETAAIAYADELVPRATAQPLPPTSGTPAPSASPGDAPATPSTSHSDSPSSARLATTGREAGAGREAGPGCEAGAADGRAVPAFDVVLLGVGPDGHVASLFPGHPARDTADTWAVAVHDSPKPPPTRISLTFPALAHADEVWFVVSGEDKADAVAQVLAGGSDLPAATPKGLSRTLWLLDQAAAGRLAE